MTNEREPFGRQIFTNPKNKGVIVVDGAELKNPVKRKFISAEILNDLESLAIEAFSAESDDSSGQSHLEESMKLQKKKYAGEQPQEVWRRDLAKLMSKGVDINTIAGSLLARNQEFLTAINLDTSSPEMRDKVLKTLEKKIAQYWPTAKQID